MLNRSYCVIQFAYCHTKVPEFSHKRRFRKNQDNNPGISNRVNKLFDKNEFSSLEYFDIDDAESDLTNAHHSYTDHKRELYEAKEKLRKIITAKKYFKQPKLPNFLTWNEKQLIKSLHKSDPEEWTIYKLAQSFPTSELGVKKLLKANWEATTDKIKHHDEVVKKNWILLQNNSLELNEELKKHLLKFSFRSNIQITQGATMMKFNTQNKLIDNSRTEEIGEFQSIIMEYRKAINKYESNNSTTKTVDVPIIKEENSLKKFKQYPVPFNVFKKISNLSDGKKSYDESKDVGSIDIIPETNVHKNEHRKVPYKLEYMGSDDCKDVKNYIQGENVDSVTIPKDVDSVDIIPETNVYKNDHRKVPYNLEPTRSEDCKEVKNYIQGGTVDSITIPKHLWVEGATYKVNDCYYHSDGDFLYRVPGKF